jgi:adenylosuccinate lyase
MRHLARTEIGEFALEMPEGHGKSSTMPHKGLSEQGAIIGNPEDFENICGQYRAVMPHIISVLLNQESEHNRDIRNSAAERYYKPEILNAFAYSTNRCNDTMRKVRANEEVMRRRVENSWNLLMEPAYIVLALDGEPNAQQYVRDVVKKYGDFKTALDEDERLRMVRLKLPDEKRFIFSSPLKYIGESPKQVDDILAYWAGDFNRPIKQ